MVKHYRGRYMRIGSTDLFRSYYIYRYDWVQTWYIEGYRRNKKYSIGLLYDGSLIW